MSTCKLCKADYMKNYSTLHPRNEYNKNYYLLNKGSIQNYRCQNKKKISKQQKEYRIKNRSKLLDYDRKYNLEHKIEKYKKHNIWEKKQKLNDPKFRIRLLISQTVSTYLKKIGKSKINSVLMNLPYTMQELKDHLQLQFEPWMSWNNWGSYNTKTWDDHNTLTWFWQIDHIIPQSELPYISVEDENFKKCWSLDNLRPLSAKQNLLDGISRIRHLNK